MSVWRRGLGPGRNILGVLVVGAVAAAAPAAPDAPVADAARAGDVEAVRALLRQGEDVNAAHADGMTALHWAAVGGGEALADVLLFAGANVGARTRLGAYTPLHLASRNGHAGLVEILLEGGSDANAMSATGATPLHLAAASGSAEAVAALVDHGAAVDARDAAMGRTPLLFAAGSGRLETTRVLLARGADVAAASRVVDFVARDEMDGVDRRRRDQIIAAREEAEAEAREAAAEATRSVADEAAAQLQSRDEEEPDEEEPDEEAAREPGARREAAPRRPLSVADSTAALLLGQPDEPDEERPDSVRPDSLQAAGEPADAVKPDEGERPDSVKPEEEPDEPDEDEPDEDARDEEAEEPATGTNVPEARGFTEMVGKQGGMTALHYAARDGHAEIARALLDAGADIDQMTGGDRSSPLLVALINGHYDLAMQLLERGADPNLASDDGVAPLFATLNNRWAPKALYPQPTAFKQQRTDYLDVMRALLGAGADPDARTDAHTWYTSYNFDLLGVDFVRATPFWRAAYATDVDAMELLVAYGADPSIPTMVPDGGRERRRRRGGGEEEDDPSGLPKVRPGDPAVYPIHAASGVGYGTARAGNSHRHVPDGWLPAVRYLVEELGADVNARDHQGYSPVHHAAARGDNELILYLVERGADVTFVSRRGQTTVDMANGPQQRVQPFPETIALLEGLGARNNHDCRSCQ